MQSIVDAGSSNSIDNKNNYAREQNRIPSGPGHVGIPGNMKADQLAKSGLQMKKNTNIPLTPEEAMPPVKAAVHKRIQLLWDPETKGRHMHSIKPQIQEWSTSFHPSRKREVVIARLRMGHILLTHS